MAARRGIEINDERLVGECKRQLPYDTSAYEALVRKYEPIVFRTCLRYLRNEQEAEEACQDAFLRVFHALPRFEERSAFRTWLFRIVANACASRWGTLKKRAAEQTKFLATAQLELPHGHDPGLEDLGEITGVIGEGLDWLSSDDRKVLILRHVSELSFQELAEVLNIGLSAAKMKLYRAEQRLRIAYDQIRAGSEKESSKKESSDL